MTEKIQACRNDEEFNYSLPSELIAQEPSESRELSRLMVLNTGAETFAHEKFARLVEHIRPGDLIVLNNTRVVPSRLKASKERNGASAEVLLVREIEDNLWEVLLKPAKRIKVGDVLLLERGARADVLEGCDGIRYRMVRFHTADNKNIKDMLFEIGEVPLPPYIKRDNRPTAKDAHRYQAVYAKKEGAVAAPTAGFHFTCDLMDRIRKRGAVFAEITLHIGPGTFRPIRGDVFEHSMDEEYFETDRETADLIIKKHISGSRIIAVGTSAVRTLETLAGLAEFSSSLKQGAARSGFSLS